MVKENIIQHLAQTGNVRPIDLSNISTSKCLKYTNSGLNRKVHLFQIRTTADQHKTSLFIFGVHRLTNRLIIIIIIIWFVTHVKSITKVKKRKCRDSLMMGRVIKQRSTDS